RAQVSTKLGGCRLTRCSSSASGACNACGCGRTASGLVCHSASMLTRLSLTGSASIRRRGGARILPHHAAIAMRPLRRRRAASREGAWLRGEYWPAQQDLHLASLTILCKGGRDICCRHRLCPARGRSPGIHFPIAAPAPNAREPIRIDKRSFACQDFRDPWIPNARARAILTLTLGRL